VERWGSRNAGLNFLVVFEGWSSAIYLGCFLRLVVSKIEQVGLEIEVLVVVVLGFGHFLLLKLNLS